MTGKAVPPIGMAHAGPDRNFLGISPDLEERQSRRDRLCCACQRHAPSRMNAEVSLAAMDPVLLNPLIALIAGILVLLMPKILNYVVAIYLIAIGIIGLAHHLQ